MVTTTVVVMRGGEVVTWVMKPQKYLNWIINFCVSGETKAVNPAGWGPGNGQII